MEQRPLRLGDIVDDYCPRERRVTNHAIVAIVEDVIRQTRCTDLRHRAPLQRRPGAAAAQVSPAPRASTTRCWLTSTGGARGRTSVACRAGDGRRARGRNSGWRWSSRRRPSGDTPVEEPATAVWLAHRQLIRATLAADRERASLRPVRFPSSRCTSVRTSRQPRVPVLGPRAGERQRQRQREWQRATATAADGHGRRSRCGSAWRKHSGRATAAASDPARRPAHDARSSCPTRSDSLSASPTSDRSHGPSPARPPPPARGSC